MPRYWPEVGDATPCLLVHFVTQPFLCWPSSYADWRVWKSARIWRGEESGGGRHRLFYFASPRNFLLIMIPQLLDYLSEEILPWQKVSKNMFTLIFLEDMENDSRVSFWLLSMNNTNLLNWYILLLRLSRKVSFILEIDVSFEKTVCLMSWGKSMTIHTILSLYQAGEIQKKIHPVIDRSRQVWRNWPLHRWGHRRKGWIVTRASIWEDYIVLCL